jgi:hypothetical protein
MPVVRRLFQTINAFLQEADKWCTILTALIETFWLIHVKFFVQVSVEKGTVDVSLFAVKAKVCHKGEYDSKSSELDSRGKRLIEVQTVDLREPFSAEARLVSSNGAICMSLCFKYPFASDSFATDGQADKIPRVTTNERVVFGVNGSKPICRIRGSNGRLICKRVDCKATGKESRRRMIAALREEIFSSREADVGLDNTTGSSGRVVGSGRHRRRSGGGPWLWRWRPNDTLGGIVEDRRSGGVDVIVGRVTVRVTDMKSLLR